MLGGDDDGVDPGDLAILVLYGNLGLAIRLQQRIFAAHLGQLTRQLVRIIDRSRHVFIALIAGIAEHDALIACADHMISMVDRMMDLAGLLVHPDHDRVLFLVTDLADHVFRDLRIIDMCLGVCLSIDQHEVVLDRGFHRHVGIRILTQRLIQDGVRDLIADLVRMTLCH